MTDHPRNLKIEDYTYELPEHKIAAFPAPERDGSRLLIYRDGQISENIYRNIAAQLPTNALLIFNNTKVIHARLLMQKQTGGSLEIFALEPHSRYNDVSTAMASTGSVWWICLVGGAAKWKDGQVLTKTVLLNGSELKLTARMIQRLAGSFLIEFTWHPDTVSFSQVLHVAGAMPIPPYLKREAVEPDTDRYQTVFAKEEGSVAAPTAGLHFTKSVIDSLSIRGISHDYVTLHVGAGTFMPVKSESMEGHEMHEEFMDISSALIDRLLHHGKPVFCVGTTSLRTIETLYWMGVKTALDPTIKYEALAVKQWEVYELQKKNNISPNDALRSLSTWMNINSPGRLVIKTQILIAPGYRFRLTTGLITNFHQPRSTLLLLVAAMVGNAWKGIYDYALKNGFRFLSYGDGCLLFLQ